MTRSKNNRLCNKNRLPVLDSDEEFLKAFTKKDKPKTAVQEKTAFRDAAEEQDCEDNDDSLENEDFAAMLEESFKIRKSKLIGKPKPTPLKKRLKRYPGVELELDLHGYNAIGAQLKLRSFLQSCKYQGYFTLRIIVGRGLHSENGAVLPDIVEDELKEMKKQNIIIWYEWDRKQKRNAGSIIVYLKQFEQYE
ncbi:MAG: Smr/MutS family protein [Deltaproteobacteria bacterium]|jgi:DNA-nicking Smr family endonuclease|nr:Smr/MutS family protein [Deltaproteobacteria bacterium]